MGGFIINNIYKIPGITISPNPKISFPYSSFVGGASGLVTYVVLTLNNWNNSIEGCL